MKKWFLERFLPMWAKETVMADNKQLFRENQRLKQENKRLEAYIAGVQLGQRAVKQIRIYNRGGEA